MLKIIPFEITSEFLETLDRCVDRLFFYSPYNFIRGHDRKSIVDHTILAPLTEKISQGAITVKKITIKGELHFALIEPLAWDTEYFGFPIYKIHTVLYTHDNYMLLKDAMQQLAADISGCEHSYYFLDLPAEDIYLIQAVCECGFRLTETRLHYVFSNLDSYSGRRYQVRSATEDDIENLRTVAVQMRNTFDRLHSDTAFSQEIADGYLATYIENSVRGFADVVLVPAVGDGPPDGFVTSSFPVKILDWRISSIGAAAVSRKTRKGWGSKILSETIYALLEKGSDYIVTNTQAPNKEVQTILNYFGFRLARVTHIFSKLIPPTSELDHE